MEEVLAFVVLRGGLDTETPATPCVGGGPSLVAFRANLLEQRRRQAMSLDPRACLDWWPKMLAMPFYLLNGALRAT